MQSTPQPAKPHLSPQQKNPTQIGTTPATTPQNPGPHPDEPDADTHII